MKSISESTIAELKSISPDELVAHGIIREARNHRGRNGYVCPFPDCNSGGHDTRDSDGAGTFDDKNQFYCHACQNRRNGGHKLSTIDLFKMARHLESAPFYEICKAMADEFNVRYDEFDSPEPMRASKERNFSFSTPQHTETGNETKTAPADDAEIKFIRADLQAPEQALVDFVTYGKWRGLPVELLLKHGCRFISDWTPPKSRAAEKYATPTPRVIIPCNDSSYLARLTKPVDDYDERTRQYITEKPHAGNKTLFNPAALKSTEPIFCVEGYIDAMTIELAGFNAVALGGAGLGNLLVDAVKDFQVKPRIILLLDSDKSGRDAAPILQSDLIKVCCPAVIKFLTDEVSKIDCNQILVDNGVDVLRGRLQSIVDESLSELEGAIDYINSGAVFDDEIFYDLDGNPYTEDDDISFYDPDDETGLEKEKSFSLSTPPGDDYSVVDSVDVRPAPTGDFELDGQLVDWQCANADAPIAPATVDKLKSAAQFVSDLTVENFKSDYVCDVLIREKVALLFFYAPKIADKFFDVLIAATEAARENIKVVKADATDETKKLSKIYVSKFKLQIDKLVTNVARAQKDFAEKMQLKANAERRKKAKQKNAAAVTRNEEELDRLRAEPRTRERDDRMRQLINDSVEWKVDRQGNRVEVKSTGANAKKIFTYDPALDGLIGFDEFQQCDVFLRTAGKKKKGDELSDRDVATLRTYLREAYTEFRDKQTIDDYLTTFSENRSFHPVKEFFRNLPKWDGVPRAKTLFIDYLQADDTDATREFTWNWLVAAVARIFRPGCRYQLTLVLQGNQGIGKTYLLEQLGGAWYGTLADNVDDPHAIDAINKLWLVEIKEASAWKKADAAAQKRFLDCSSDTRRLAYAKRPTTINRHCVFAMTTNETQLFSDITGNRRYMTIRCNAPAGHFVTFSKENAAQIWAEVYEYYLRELDPIKNEDAFDAALTLSAETKSAAEQISQGFMRDDSLQAEVEAFLDARRPPLAIWHLLSKDERRRFFAEGGRLPISGGYDELANRIKACGGCKRDVNKKISELLDALHTENVCPDFKPNNAEHPSIVIYGTELRQHICAAEVNNECFDRLDRRKSVPRINEILSRVEGWTKGAPIYRDPAYGKSTIVFYRDKPTTTDDATETADNSGLEKEKFSFDGEIVDLEDIPM